MASSWLSLPCFRWTFPSNFSAFDCSLAALSVFGARFVRGFVLLLCSTALWTTVFFLRERCSPGPSDALRQAFFRHHHVIFNLGWISQLCSIVLLYCCPSSFLLRPVFVGRFLCDVGSVNAKLCQLIWRFRRTSPVAEISIIDFFYYVILVLSVIHCHQLGVAVTVTGVSRDRSA